MRQSMRFSAAGLGLVAGLISVLAFRDTQAEQPQIKVAASTALVVEKSAVQKPAAGSTAAQPSAIKPSATAQDSNLSALVIQSGGKDASGFTLSGRDSRQQLIVTGTLAASGELRDLTRKVHYTAEPAGIVRIDDVGLVWPLADGKATIAAVAPGGQKSSIAVNVVQFKNDPPVNFPNQIVPIFAKLGCNAGGFVMGRRAGQNGFRLSLLGLCRSEDYEHLVVKEGRGRRLSPPPHTER